MPGLNRIINHLNTFKSTIPAINRAYNESIQQLHQESTMKTYLNFNLINTLILKSKF